MVIKRNVFLTLIVAFVALVVSCGDSHNKQIDSQGYDYPQAEYHKAGVILIYTPGTELFNGVIYPIAGLYERCFDITTS